MVAQYSIYSALYLLIKANKTLSSLMMAIRRQENISRLLSSFLSLKASSLQVSCINGNRSLSCMSWRNMSRKMGLSTYVGAEIFRWNFKYETFRLLNVKARTTNSGFWKYLLRIGKIRDVLLPLILAFSAFTCNRQYGKML